MNSVQPWLGILLAASIASAAERTTAPSAPPAEKPPATVGGKGGEPAAPVKAVEEPVFQLPELVIIGENQARIMAQKEQLTATPLKGLHEAPLLEKEEGSVMALRQREPAPGAGPFRAGPHALVKAEAGTAGWLGAAGWIGRQRETEFLGAEVSGSRLTGVPVGFGHAGGWDAAAALQVGHVMRDGTRTVTGIERLMHFGMTPDAALARVGLDVQSRELPYFATAASRRMTRIGAAGDSSEQPRDTLSRGAVDYVRLESPAGATNGLHLALTHGRPVWSRDALVVRLQGELEGEAAGRSGNHELLGASLLAGWVPGERLRGEAGVRLQGMFGGGTVAKSARPAGGLSYTLPSGPTVSARFAPGLNVPWFTREAAANPYGVFTRQLVPERELANAELSIWQGWRDGTFVRGAYRFIETRDAATWVERAGQGLWEPAQVSALRTQELSLDGTMPVEVLGSLLPGSRWAVTAAGRWRALGATAGPGTSSVQMTNLPRAQGSIGFTAAWRTLSGDLTAEIVRWRPATAVAGPPELKPFLDLGLGVVWKPVGWGQAFARISNLAGSDVVRWAGYPEPKALARAGAMVSF